MQFFSTYGMIAGIAYGLTLDNASKFSIYEIIGCSISLALTLGILIFMELMSQKNKNDLVRRYE